MKQTFPQPANIFSTPCDYLWGQLMSSTRARPRRKRGLFRRGEWKSRLQMERAGVRGERTLSIDHQRLHASDADEIPGRNGLLADSPGSGGAAYSGRPMGDIAPTELKNNRWEVLSTNRSPLTGLPAPRAICRVLATCSCKETCRPFLPAKRGDELSPPRFFAFMHWPCGPHCPPR